MSGLSPREEAQARRLRAMGFTEPQVRAAIAGRREAVRESWRKAGF